MIEWPFVLVGGFIAVTAVLVIALAVVGIVYAILYGARRARERREALERLAAELGLDFHEADPWGLPARYKKHFNLFNEGHSRKASSILAGRLDGRSVTVFDYEYTTTSTRTVTVSGPGGRTRTETQSEDTTWSYQAAVLEMPIRAPHLALRRESFLDRMAEWVGFDDIDFESGEFSRRYHVKCEERRFAYDVFHARLIQYLLDVRDVPSLEMRGDLLLLHEPQGGAEKARRLLEVGRRIIESLPEYVVKARPAAPAP